MRDSFLKLLRFIQEAALFSGTLRFNLDPLDKYSDEHIWHTIHSTKLTDYLSKMANGLNTLIETDGLGLSNGEKQVITCIRGLLSTSPFPNFLFEYAYI